MHLKKLRELRLKAVPQPDRPLHLSAASGLVRVGSSWYVVADDELQLGVFSLSDAVPGKLIRLLSGDLPDSKEDRKKVKPDFEALTLLMPFGNYGYGALLALSSGSKRSRRRGVLLAFSKDGAVVASPRIVDASGLYDAAKREVRDLNIEGAVVIDDQLVLVHRGNKSNAVNATIAFSLAAVLQSIEDTDSIAAVPVLAVRHYDLGSIDGVPLCFTDAAALPDGTLVFSAVAEDTSDTYHDGRCVGAAIGTIGIDGTLQDMYSLDVPYKVEGIHAELEGEVVRLWLVTDADDASIPASLFSAELRVV